MLESYIVETSKIARILRFLYDSLLKQKKQIGEKI